MGKHRLKILRLRTKVLNEDQETFGARFGVGAPAVARWESIDPRKARNPSKAVLLLIAQLEEKIHLEPAQ